LFKTTPPPPPLQPLNHRAISLSSAKEHTVNGLEWTVGERGWYLGVGEKGGYLGVGGEEGGVPEGKFSLS
jgi:hypothetical protein